LDKLLLVNPSNSLPAGNQGGGNEAPAPPEKPAGDNRLTRLEKQYTPLSNHINRETTHY